MRDTPTGAKSNGDVDRLCQFLLGLLGLGHHGEGIDGHDFSGHAADVHDANHEEYAYTPAVRDARDSESARDEAEDRRGGRGRWFSERLALRRASGAW